MADIFVSYKSEDHARARLISQTLQAEGFEVWYDHSLQAGEDYQEVIDRELRTALVVVVLWSKQSVKSRWVRSEATIGDRNGALAPAMVEPCDLPTAFVLVQTADLSTWTGDRNDPEWRAYTSDIAAKAQKRKAEKSSGAAVALPDVELVYWQSIKDSTDAADLRSYLKRYPGGNFASLAKGRLSALASASKDSKGKGAPLLLAVAIVVVAAAGVGAYIFRDVLMPAHNEPAQTVVPETVVPPAPADAKPDAEASAREMDAAWKEARKANIAKAYADFLEKYPTGPYADAARSALASLTPPQTKPSAAPPAQATAPSTAAADTGPVNGIWTVFASCAGGAKLQEPDAKFSAGQFFRRFGNPGNGGETFLTMSFNTPYEIRATGALKFDNGQVLGLEAVGAGRDGFYSGTATLGPGSNCPFTATRKSS